MRRVVLMRAWWGRLDFLSKLSAASSAILAVLLLLGAGLLFGGEQNLGQVIYYNVKPSCVVCHNEKQGNLARSRADRDTVAQVITHGVSGKMPGYRLSDQELDALVNYVMSLRRTK
jgi:mono/diheme cytochrome c family protein